MNFSAQGIALLILVPLLAAAVAIAVYAGRLYLRQTTTLRQASARVETLEAGVRARDEEVHYLVEHRLPTVVHQLLNGQPAVPPELRDPRLAGTPFAATLERLFSTVTDVVAQGESRGEQAARAAVRSVARPMTALLNELQKAISAMIARHDDPEVLADGYHVDHLGSQLNRRVQIWLLLSDSWSGRQREDSRLRDVVRGGVSHIKDYPRIQVVGDLNICVISRVVQPVVLTLAEMLDNAARHSEPGTNVEVFLRRSHNGVSVIIDDSGIGLKPEDAEEAERLLSGTEEVLLTQLPSRPRLGLAAVGVLAARYGFTASINDGASPYGGVRAVLHLPSTLLTTPGQVETPPAAVHTAQTAPQARPFEAQPEEAAAQPPPGEMPAEVRTTADGLPRRRRHQRIEEPASPAAAEPPADFGAFAAFTRGRQEARRSHPPLHAQSDDERKS
ncbi:hypothetical protein AN219_38005 [Streptomyces nanshensis]|nr:hypothetical protein AN219_38005 [Streptomyces nanshensis]